MSVNVRLAHGEDQAFIEALGLQTALETVSPARAVTKHDADQALRRNHPPAQAALAVLSAWSTRTAGRSISGC